MIKHRMPLRRKDNFGRVFKVWLSQHAQSFISSLGQLLRNPASNLFSTTVIGISLALPAGFYLILENAERIMESWEGTVQIALYLHPEVMDTEAAELRDTLSRNELIENVELITKEQALTEYKKFSGFAEAIDALEENPLPSMLLVQPRIESLSQSAGEILFEQLGHLPEVETAQFDRQWVQRLYIILHILRRAVIILSTLLSVAVLLVIGNTIRLSIINRRTEIEINKLFGATNSFIQRPFLYTGFIYGIAGSIIAWMLLFASIAIMEAPVKQLAGLYNSDFRLQGLDFKELGILMITGGSLGLLGSWIAVGRHISELEPR